MRLNSNGKLFGIRGMRGMNTLSPFPDPVNIVASMTFLCNLVIRNLVPLQSLGGFKFLNKITGAPIFNLIVCDGSPGTLIEFKNSTV